MSSLKEVKEAMAVVRRLYDIEPMPREVDNLLTAMEGYILFRNTDVEDGDDGDDGDEDNIFGNLGRLMSTYQNDYAPEPEKHLTSEERLAPQMLSIEFEGSEFTVMTLFQAHKCFHRINMKSSEQTRQDVLAFADMSLAQATDAGAKIDLDVPLWDANRDNIMRDLCETAFSQNLEAKKTLMQMQGEIVEDTLPDRYWGNTNGKNKYGELLMMIRDSLVAKKNSKNGKRKMGE